MTKAKKSRFSYSVGERGKNRMREYAHPVTGLMFLEFASGEYTSAATSVGRRRPKVQRVALGHSDVERAKQAAEEVAAKLRTPDRDATEPITLAKLFDNYIREVTPQKSLGKQQHDRMCAEMFLRAFGSQRQARTLSRLEWDRFIRDRKSGLLAPVSSRGTRAVRNRVVAYDLRFLLAVLKWATEVTDSAGRPLLERNPLKGFPLPKEENPVRPCFNRQQYESLGAIAPSISSLYEVALVMAYETGHRIGSICQLQWADIDFAAGTVLWRAENDKMGREHRTPLPDGAAQALERLRAEQQAIGTAWIFPSPSDASFPCSRHLVRDWMEKALKRLDFPKGQRWGWHAFRRQFATELKDTPLKDLCALGGWRDHQTILKCYQQPDEITMRAALQRRQEVRTAVGSN